MIEVKQPGADSAPLMVAGGSVLVTGTAVFGDAAAA
jgi:hypothetical protein